MQHWYNIESISKTEIIQIRKQQALCCLRIFLMFVILLMETIILNDLSIGYHSRKEQRVVASGITASLFSDELTCLIGANGVGKSTLLRTLAGFQKPLVGDIAIHDVAPLSEITPHELAKIVGIVLTTKPDITAMRVEEVVGMGRSPYTGFWGVQSQSDRKVVDEAIEWVGIGQLRHRYFHTLSDGERQKVMIARVLAQQTRVVLLDEPTAFLDYPSKVEMFVLLRKLAHQLHKTIFLSTHDLELALQLTDKLWLMEKEKSEKACSPSRLYVGTPRQLADEGVLSRFIDREGIHLDPQTLRISVTKE